MRCDSGIARASAHLWRVVRGVLSATRAGSTNRIIILIFYVFRFDFAIFVVAYNIFDHWRQLFFPQHAVNLEITGKPLKRRPAILTANITVSAPLGNVGSSK